MKNSRFKIKKILSFKLWFLILHFAFCITPWGTVIAQRSPSTDATRGVALIDYIAGDYQMAVDEGGEQILDEAEFAEMKDFADLIGHYLTNLGISPDDSLARQWQELNRAINQKDPVPTVQQKAASLKGAWIDRFAIPTAPSFFPDLNRGKEIYLQACSQCHGAIGMADTPTALQLDPSPIAFAKPENLDRLSPFKAYNTITFGVQNTAMPSFSAMSEKDRWAVAAYLFTLREGLPSPTQEKPILSWDKAMALNDQELIGQLTEILGSPEKTSVQLSQIRHLAYNGDDEKGGAQKEKGLQGLTISISHTRKSLDLLERGDFQLALDQAVAAYLDGFEQSEIMLKASGQNSTVREVEELFINYRQRIREGNKASADEAGRTLLEKLVSIRQTLHHQQSLSPGMAFLASFAIIFREGLEAILLLAIILSVVATLRQTQYIRWIHVSWASALVVGFVTWLLAREIISGAVREGMEGWVGLIAAAVLVYVSFWLFAKRDVEIWKRFLIGRIRGKKNLGITTIVSVSFLAVYREVFETVLFFETLRLQAPGHGFSLLGGVISALAGLGLAAWFIFSVGRKIPLNAFFSVSGTLLYMLAVVFVGQSIHSFQEANLISLTPTPFFRVPPLGIFPTLETLAAQGLLMAIYLTGQIWQQWIKKPEAEARLGSAMAKASLELFDIHELEEHLMEHLNEVKTRIGKKQIADDEMKEILGHMHDLDRGIHHVIVLLSQLESEIPQRFEELFAEVEELQKGGTHHKLVEKARLFKNHLETIKSRRPME